MSRWLFSNGTALFVNGQFGRTDTNMYKLIGLCCAGPKMSLVGGISVVFKFLSISWWDSLVGEATFCKLTPTVLFVVFGLSVTFLSSVGCGLWVIFLNSSICVLYCSTADRERVFASGVGHSTWDLKVLITLTITHLRWVEAQILISDWPESDNKVAQQSHHPTLMQLGLTSFFSPVSKQSN